MSGTGGRTRRELLADTAKAAAAASVAGLAGCFPDVGGRWPDASACKIPDAREENAAVPAISNAVVEVFREGSVVSPSRARNVIQPEVVAAMLDAGLAGLARAIAKPNASSSRQDGGTGGEDAARSTLNADQDVSDGTYADGGIDDNPWKVLLPTYRPGQRIGLKVNCLNQNAPTSRYLIRAIVTSLRDRLGVAPTDIIVWDRHLSELKSNAKYTDEDLAGAQLRGTLQVAGKETTGDPGYGDPISPAIECQTPRLSRILTEQTDLTINCPVLKTHNVSGVTAALKNIYGIIDIPGKYHRPLLQAALPALYALPAIRNSISLTIVDGLVGVIKGDTDSSDVVPIRRILLAQDPVAMDSYAVDLVNQLRSAADLPAPPVEAELLTWIARAEALGLGTTKYSLTKA
jgi:uncharacterized protein (DUF362 family)